MNFKIFLVEHIKFWRKKIKALICENSPGNIGATEILNFMFLRTLYEIIFSEGCLERLWVTEVASQP